jgi:alkanesulfonate monooxygenase
MTIHDDPPNLFWFPPTSGDGDGALLGHDERYQQTAEFLAIWQGLFNGGIDFAGQHLMARQARLGVFDSVQKPHPPLWLGGSSPAGIAVAAEHVSTYRTWAEPPAMVAEKLSAFVSVAPRNAAE